jgi:hypothetical protein
MRPSSPRYQSVRHFDNAGGTGSERHPFLVAVHDTRMRHSRGTVHCTLVLVCRLEIRGSEVSRMKPWLLERHSGLPIDGHEASR